MCSLRATGCAGAHDRAALGSRLYNLRASGGAREEGEWTVNHEEAKAAVKAAHAKRNEALQAVADLEELGGFLMRMPLPGITSNDLDSKVKRAVVLAAALLTHIPEKLRYEVYANAVTRLQHGPKQVEAANAALASALFCAEVGGAA